MAGPFEFFVSVKFWRKGNKCQVNKMSIPCRKDEREMKREEEAGMVTGKLGFLVNIDNSVHLASHIISSPHR